MTMTLHTLKSLADHAPKKIAKFPGSNSWKTAAPILSYVKWSVIWKSLFTKTDMSPAGVTKVQLYSGCMTAAVINTRRPQQMCLFICRQNCSKMRAGISVFILKVKTL